MKLFCVLEVLPKKPHAFNAKVKRINASQGFKHGQTQEEAVEKEDSHNNSKGFAVTPFFSTLCKGDLQ